VAGARTTQAPLTHRRANPVISRLKFGSSLDGGTVTITGKRLDHAIQVTINGSPAIITRNSGSRISVLVPSRALGGPVTVTTPLGTVTAHGFPVLP
jgi:uncharacterized protein (TIGR03437 family)